MNWKTRIGTMVLDHGIMTIVVACVALPGIVYDKFQSQSDSGIESNLRLGHYFVYFACSLYFNKDIYLGRSPAKRILKLQLVDIRTNKPANPIRCLVRNITIIILPIEVVFAIINNERRIGDFIAGTTLTTYDPLQHKAAANWPLILAAVALSIPPTYYWISTI